VALIKTDYEEAKLQPTPTAHPQLADPLFLSPHDILKKKKLKKIIEIDEKRFRKKVALIKTDYKEERLQPTPAGHLQLATPLFLYPLDTLSWPPQRLSTGLFLGMSIAPL
jgi:transposase